MTEVSNDLCGLPKGVAGQRRLGPETSLRHGDVYAAGNGDVKAWADAETWVPAHVEPNWDEGSMNIEFEIGGHVGDQLVVPRVVTDDKRYVIDENMMIEASYSMG
eukprot:832808-Heterocapsa_arctica.AAC.1